MVHARESLREAKAAVIAGMATLCMSEAEVTRDLHTVLVKVQQDIEVVIEQNHILVAVLKMVSAPTTGPGHKLSEYIALAKAYEEKLGYAPMPDVDFAQDMQASAETRRDSLVLPMWD